MAFHEPLRLALARYAEGVHLAGPPAPPAAMEAASARCGAPLPPDYADFLRSWDGASLFHEGAVLYGSGDPGLGCPVPGQWRIGETQDGALWMDRQGVIRLVDEEAPDPIVAGTSLERWLAAFLAREAQLFDREGEFRDVLDEEGAFPPALRQKRAALWQRHDPGAALPWLEEAELRLEAHETEAALAALEQAVARDPGAGPAWELLGALHRQAGRPGEAEHAFAQAAAATPDPGLRASRLLDAALAAPEAARRRLHAQAAAEADPGHARQLLGQAEAALREGQGDEAAHLAGRLALLQEARPDPAMEAPLGALQREVRTRQALRTISG